jgi:hypothetical protein
MEESLFDLASESCKFDDIARINLSKQLSGGEDDRR